MPSPKPSQNFDASLTGVSCVSATACTAVGNYLYPSPSDPSDYLTGTLAESWDGTSWSVVPSPSPSPGIDRRGPTPMLTGVSCISPATCTAAGYYTNTSHRPNTLIETGTGR